MTGLRVAVLPIWGGFPTKWAPGADTASFHGSGAPAGPMMPGAASWSIMPAGTASDAFDPHVGAGTIMTAAVTGLMTGLGMGTEEATIGAAMAVWASASEFTNLGMVADSGEAFNTPEPGPGNMFFGDIRLGAIAFDGSSGVLAHGFQPGTSATFAGTPTIGGDIHFDSAETWCDNAMDPTCAGGAGFDFFSVALHEIGHALGLGHTSIAGSVMLPSISAGTVARTLGAEDIAGITALYGPAAVVVPVPATVWLFSSSILVFVGFRRFRNV